MGECSRIAVAAARILGQCHRFPCTLAGEVGMAEEPEDSAAQVWHADPGSSP